VGPRAAHAEEALAFGPPVVMLLVVGSLWLMTNLNQNMMPMEAIPGRQR